MFKGRDQQICASLFSWINDGSHNFADDLYVAADDTIVSRYLAVFKQIFPLHQSRRALRDDDGTRGSVACSQRGCCVGCCRARDGSCRNEIRHGRSNSHRGKCLMLTFRHFSRQGSECINSVECPQAPDIAAAYPLGFLKISLTGSCPHLRGSTLLRPQARQNRCTGALWPYDRSLVGRELDARYRTVRASRTGQPGLVCSAGCTASRGAVR